MKNFILLEFFTSQSIYDAEINQYILKEALNITNSIIKNFSRNSEINKLYVVRNQELETFEAQKVKFLSTNKKKSFIDILKNFNTDSEIIVIAPETNKVNINFFSLIKNKFTFLNSSLYCLKIFSSKIRTYNALKKLNIPVVKTYNFINSPKKKIIIKPIYGAGSENVSINKSSNFKGNKNNYVFQKYYEGIKGSFLMLCHKGKCRVICCNKQIIEIKNQRIRQIGCIIGGLENYRKEIVNLANKISNGFNGLFGIIGVDIVKDGEKWLVVDVNARFTSSYCGLEYADNQKLIDDISEFYVKKVFNQSKINFFNKTKYFFNE